MIDAYLRSRPLSEMKSFLDLHCPLLSSRIFRNCIDFPVIFSESHLRESWRITSTMSYSSIYVLFYLFHDKYPYLLSDETSAHILNLVSREVRGERRGNEREEIFRALVEFPFYAEHWVEADVRALLMLIGICSGKSDRSYHDDECVGYILRGFQLPELQQISGRFFNSDLPDWLDKTGEEIVRLELFEMISSWCMSYRKMLKFLNISRSSFPARRAEVLSWVNRGEQLTILHGFCP